MEKEVCLLNDSFYPIIDGVANAVQNYARVITEEGGSACVVTPKVQDAEDGRFPYPVIRYPGIDMRKRLGYEAGNPFDLQVQMELRQRDIGILHSHCPVMSTILARELRTALDVPMVLTYHSRYDVDIEKLVKAAPVRQGVLRALVESVSSCDELWTVSDGAGRSIQKLGYEGGYIVMPNGVDIPRGRASEALVAEVCAPYDLPAGIPVYLFVGRMMWYKGLRVILDALAALRSQNMDFRMVFVGGGGDIAAVRAYAEELLLSDRCVFAGPEYDRERLRAWYTRADLFLFPSTYDTNGLVVREAAACSLASVLIRDSCAAEGVTDRRNGFLIANTAASLAVCLTQLSASPGYMKEAGQAACRELYFSWEDAVHMALDRYGTVTERYRSGGYRKKKKISDGMIDIVGDVVDMAEQLDILWKELRRL